MPATALLKRIRNDLAALFPLVSQDGYQDPVTGLPVVAMAAFFFDWTKATVNEYDENAWLLDHPNVLVRIDKEIPSPDYAAGGVNADQYDNILDVEFWVCPNFPEEFLKDGDVLPGADYEDELDKVDHDLKKIMRIYNSYRVWLAIMYNGHEKFAHPNKLRAGWIKHKWRLFYNQSQSHPDLFE